VTLYLDASVLVSVVAQEATSPLVDRLVRSQDTPVAISDFALAEGSAALSRLARMNARRIGDVDEMFIELDALSATFADRVEIASGDIAAATQLVRRHELKLRTPDAIHIAAADRLAMILVTLDQGMAAAARAVGLSCINPAEGSAA
jgi:predicted nucleic acid-binding protein